MTIKMILLPAIAIAAAFAATSFAAESTTVPDTQKPSSSVVSWLKDADVAGNAEVASAQLAVAKAQRDDVKAFAQKMADEHGQVNKEIADLATKKGVVLPAEKPATHSLDSTSASAFDAAYLKAQVKEHENAVKLFEKGAKSTDPDIRAFAEKTLTTIREHLAEVRRLAAAAKS